MELLPKEEALLLKEVAFLNRFQTQGLWKKKFGLMKKTSCDCHVLCCSAAHVEIH